MTSPHPLIDRFMQMQEERRHRRLLYCTIIAIFVVVANFLVAALGKINALQATLSEMNKCQKSVVVKQHDAITASLTAEIRRAVEEIRTAR